MVEKKFEEIEDYRMAQQKPFKCNPCNQTFSGTASLISHLKKSHQNLDCGLFQCPNCLKQFSTRSTMARHIRKSNCFNLDDYPFNCKLCDKCFKRNNRLNQHVFQDHECERLVQLRKQEEEILGECNDDDENQDDFDNEHDELDLDDDDDDDEDEREEGFDDIATFLNDKNINSGSDGNNHQHANLNQTQKSWKELKCKWPECNFIADSFRNVRAHRRLVHFGNFLNEYYIFIHYVNIFLS